MHELATKAGRYKIYQNIPTRSELSEAEQAELEEFLSNIKILTSSLGYKIFEALEETISKPFQKEMASVNTKVEPHIFYCKNSSGLVASGSPSTEGFIVYKDSLFTVEDQQSVPESIRIEKENMHNKGYFLRENNFLKLNRDYVFNSPSRGACMILARSANGLTEWKTEEGIPLKQVQS